MRKTTDEELDEIVIAAHPEMERTSIHINLFREPHAHAYELEIPIDLVRKYNLPKRFTAEKIIIIKKKEKD